jgi:hypothetical protein
MTITAARLRTWSERICTLPSTDAREVVQALGIEGSVVSRFNALVIDPPVEGALEVKAVERQGRFDRISVQLAGETLPRAELEQCFGRGVAARHGEPDSYFTVSYRLALPGAPFGCDVSAEFATEPTDETPVAGITLRRQPAQPASADKPQMRLTELVDVIATTAAKLRQESGADIKRHLEEVRDQVAHAGAPAAPAAPAAPGTSTGGNATAAAGAAAAQARKTAATAEVEKLVDAVARAGAAASRVVAKQGTAAASQAPGVLDLSSLTDALRRFTALLQSGAPESQDKITELLGQLEARFGSSVGKVSAADTARPRREDEEHRAEIPQDVQASIDEISPGKKKP